MCPERTCRKATHHSSANAASPFSLRFGLGLSRYISAVLVAVIAIIVTTIVRDGLIYFYFGVLQSSSFLLEMIIGFVFESAVLVGIVLLISRSSNSGGSVVGAGMMLWVATTFFWGLIPTAVDEMLSKLGYVITNVSTHQVSILNFINLSGFYVLLREYSTSAIISGGPLSISSFATNVAAYWVTPFYIVLSGALWIVLPLSAFFYLTVKKD